MTLPGPHFDGAWQIYDGACGPAATQFEMVIHMKAANALGIKMPQSILSRVDKVIE